MCPISRSSSIILLCHPCAKSYSTMRWIFISLTCFSLRPTLRSAFKYLPSYPIIISLLITNHKGSPLLLIWDSHFCPLSGQVFSSPFNVCASQNFFFCLIVFHTILGSVLGSLMQKMSDYPLQNMSSISCVGSSSQRFPHVLERKPQCWKVPHLFLVKNLTKQVMQKRIYLLALSSPR